MLFTNNCVTIETRLVSSSLLYYSTGGETGEENAPSSGIDMITAQWQIHQHFLHKQVYKNNIVHLQSFRVQITMLFQIMMMMMMMMMTKMMLQCTMLCTMMKMMTMTKMSMW